MAPDWDKLSEDYAGSSSVLIADVDCTVEADLCQKFDVKGYPTIKYWVDGVATPYEGGRDLEALQKFTKDTLNKPCQIEDPKDCSDKERDFLTKMKEAGPDAIAKQLERLTGMSATRVKAELKQWLNQRLNILRQLASSIGGDKGDL